MTSTKYGFEQFADDLEALLKAKLNDKIAQVNAEFTETTIDPPEPPKIEQLGPKLDLIPEGAYFFQTADAKVFNFNPFVMYFAGNPSIDDSSYSGIVETYRFTVLICYAKDNSTLEMGKQLARYNRCLKELILENLRIGKKKIKIVGLEPAGLAAINDTNTCYTTGITIEVTFGD